MAVILDRKCTAGCGRLLFTRREVADGDIKIDIAKHAIAHCDASRTCNWCVQCHRAKLDECGLKKTPPPERA